MTQETFIAGKLVKTNKKVWKDGEEFTTQSSDDKEVRMTFTYTDVLDYHFYQLYVLGLTMVFFIPRRR